MKSWKMALLTVGVLALLAARRAKKAVTLPMKGGTAIADPEENLLPESEAVPNPSGQAEDGAVDAPEENQLEAPEEPEETEVPEAVREAVRVDGVLYYATGEPSSLTARCGTWDGVIETTVPEDELPQEDDSSNFGTGYMYQFAAEGSIELNIDGQWMVFRREDVCGLPVAANREQTLPVEPKEPLVLE